jgi:hypothetical protein
VSALSASAGFSTPDCVTDEQNRENDAQSRCDCFASKSEFPIAERDGNHQRQDAPSCDLSVRRPYLDFGHGLNIGAPDG